VSLLYFTCLGAGFIIIELVYIQKFMRLLGSPLYTYSLVIAVMLLGAGIGSYASQKLGISPHRRWYWPFAGVLSYGLLLLALHGAIFEWTLTAPFEGRALVACLLLLPMGFFLGMPFPLGILTLADKPPGAVAWAWGMNGLFTVIGGLLAVIVSVEWGFTITLLFAFALYLAALLLMGRMRTST
jgi:hypothetical protein